MTSKSSLFVRNAFSVYHTVSKITARAARGARQLINNNLYNETVFEKKKKKIMSNNYSDMLRFRRLRINRYGTRRFNAILFVVIIARSHGPVIAEIARRH